MAVKKEPKIKTEEAKMEPVIMEEAKKEKVKIKSGVWLTVGWILLLVGGLAHMLPAQMAPVLKLAVAGVTVQMAVGVLSVIVALYFLLEE